MTRRQLAKVRSELEELRARLASIRPAELVALAKKMGRKLVNRGKEPTYEHPNEDWPPLTIPAHPGTLPKGTAHSILRALEADLERLEEVAEDGDGVGEEAAN